MKKLLNLLVVITIAILLTGCSDAEIVSNNISKDADAFRVKRRIVFTNLRTGEYLFMIEGNCSINVDASDYQLEVTCRLGEDKYQKHFLGLSEGVTYTVEQLEWVEADKYKYQIIFKPDSILPIEIEVQH